LTPPHTHIDPDDPKRTLPPLQSRALSTGSDTPTRINPHRPGDTEPTWPLHLAVKGCVNSGATVTAIVKGSGNSASRVQARVE
jgi:hypothetical protein